MTNDDAAVDHWAERLVFWLDELRALENDPADDAN